VAKKLGLIPDVFYGFLDCYLIEILIVALMWRCKNKRK